MRTVAGLVVASAVAFSFASGAGAASSPRAAVLAVIRAQDAAYNARDWKRLWSYYSPEYRHDCNYATWVAGSKAHLDPHVTTRVTSIRLAGSKAYVAYDVVVRGKVVERVFPGDPDRFVLVRGRWYDDIDDHTSCGGF